MRAAALLRIARAEWGGDAARARDTLLQALSAVQALSGGAREQLLDEARTVTAAVAPELLGEIPVGRMGRHGRFESMRIAQVMLAHNHVDAAYEYVMQCDPQVFPFMSIGGVLQRIEGDRRGLLLGRAVEMWRRIPPDGPFHERDEFVRVFGHFWKEFPAEEALGIAREIVAKAASEPDNGTSSRYPDGIHFTSALQSTLFLILHVLRHLDPALAGSLIESHNQLAAAAQRYSNGLETMQEEAEAETERRKAEGKACGGGYVLGGSSSDIERGMRLIEARQSGDFEACIQDALDMYAEDTAPETRNHAPKEYWPSVGACRSVFYEAGTRLGSGAAELLPRVPDDDLRLFAMIELAAALAGVPAASINRMKQPHPPGSRRFQGRIVSVGSSAGSTQSERPAMRSPDGRAIRCPKCQFRPPEGLRWQCKCGHRWNTFWTSANCPACHFQWEETGCPRCGEMSEHTAWYVSEA